MFRKKITISISFAVLLFMLGSINVYASTNTKRLSGANRYATSLAVASEGWTQSDYAIIAYGENFPDALSAAPLAKKYNAPILLTEKDALPTETINSLTALKVKSVFIIGGTGVISTNVENQIAKMGISITRLYGSDRYDTAVKIAERLDNVSEAAIVTGEDYADALSIAPIASKENMPILLAQHNVIPDVIKNYISSHNISKIYVVGGGSSIDISALSGLSNVEQINGQDKYQRNLAIINKFKDDLNLGTCYVATGENFADALSGSVLAGINSNPMLLVGNDVSPEKDFLSNNLTAITNIKILGGTGAVSNNVIDNLTGTTTTSPTTPSNTTTSSNDIVVFKDANLEKVVRDTINKPVGALHSSDVAKMRNLLAGNSNISDLSGIENLTNLGFADLHGNNISDLSPLKGLTKLYNLELAQNKISDVSPLAGLTSLEDLDLSANQINDISSLSGLTNLTSLGLGSNQISDISALKEFTKLGALDLEFNKVNDLSPLATLTNLTSLSLQGLDLKINETNNVLVLKGLTNLVRLELDDNCLSPTDISELKAALPKWSTTY